MAEVIAGVGVDVVDIARFTKLLARRPQTGSRIFHASEPAGGTPATLAARFAAKEAVMKSIGRRVALRDIRIGPRSEQPRVTVVGLSDTFHLSMSHDAGAAIAFVVRQSG